MSQHEPEASPAAQEAVRRLLAEARHDEPVPGEVADRLDRVLAGLAEADGLVDGSSAPTGESLGAHPTEAVEAAPGSAVVDLGARRRRRVVGLLGAAAAAVVLAIGVGQVVEHDGSRSDGGSQADNAESATRERSDEGAGSAEDGTADTPDDSAGTGTQQPSSVQPPGPVDVPRLGSSGFGEAVAGLRERASVETTDDGATVDGASLTTSPTFVCGSTPVGPGRLLAVTYIGRPAILAYRPVTGETQTVELLQCDTGTVVRSVVVPAP